VQITCELPLHANVLYISSHAPFLDTVCEVFTMNLEHEAIYIPKSLGRFKLPQDRLDFASLLLALGPLTAAKVSAITLIYIFV
jgi:hypothetical protein